MNTIMEIVICNGIFICICRVKLQTTIKEERKIISSGRSHVFISDFLKNKSQIKNFIINTYLGIFLPIKFII